MSDTKNVVFEWGGREGVRRGGGGGVCVGSQQFATGRGHNKLWSSKGIQCRANVLASTFELAPGSTKLQHARDPGDRKRERKAALLE